MTQNGCWRQHEHGHALAGERPTPAADPVSPEVAPTMFSVVPRRVRTYSKT